MNRFQAIVALIVLVNLGVQTLRHAYVLLLEPRGSVLDKYEPGKESVTAAKSLEELVALYETTRQKTAEIKKLNPMQKNESSYEYEDRLREQDESFRAEATIEAAIQEWESHHRDLYELHFFFLSGAMLSLIGAVFYMRIQRWAGLCLCILGALEMNWATTPSYRIFGSPVEFDRLLTFKLVYSVVALLLVAAGWVIASRTQARGCSS